jgi:flagellar basal-body rod modification protein FlgD
MQVSSATATSGSAATASSPIAAPKQQTLGMDDFMKLLATQFAQQDPLKPMDDTAFIAQTAQFSSLQQTQTLVQQMTQLSAAQDLATANSYLGRQVTVDAGGGQTAVGNVSGVNSSGSSPQIVINGQAYPLSAVLYVEPGTVTTPASQPVPAGGA